MSDFSLMDAIECGIVKLPRVPVADNIPGQEMPMFRNLWEHIRANAQKGRGKAAPLIHSASRRRSYRPGRPVPPLRNHLNLWKEKGVRVPPCFIVVCNNTSTSKLVYDYISGFAARRTTVSTRFQNGRLALFRNFDEDGNRLPAPEYPPH